jgi:hypothetical protein
VIILVIYDIGIAVNKLKGNAPIFADINCPDTLAWVGDGFGEEGG